MSGLPLKFRKKHDFYMASPRQTSFHSEKKAASFSHMYSWQGQLTYEAEKSVLRDESGEDTTAFGMQAQPIVVERFMEK